MSRRWEEPYIYLARSQFALLRGVRRARCFVADRLQWVGNAARLARLRLHAQTVLQTRGMPLETPA